MEGDGTCFYHSISYHLGYGSKAGPEIRAELCNKFNDTNNEFYKEEKKDKEAILMRKNNNVSFEEYVNGICNHEWADDYEILKVAEMLMNGEFKNNHESKNLYIINIIDKQLLSFLMDTNEKRIERKYDAKEISMDKYNDPQNIFIIYTGNHYDVLEKKNKIIY